MLFERHRQWVSNSFFACNSLEQGPVAKKVNKSQAQKNHLFRLRKRPRGGARCQQSTCNQEAELSSATTVARMTAV